MLYFIILTHRCNLHCIYCGNDIGDFVEPPEIQYSLEDLKRFLMKDPERDIAFYGGEPLLRIKLMERIMDEIPARHYIIQTNGLLLFKLKEEYLHKLDTILVSIDGRQEVNDYYRGRGTYKMVLINVKRIRELGYKGDLIARMAVSSKTDIFEDVVHLLQLGLFNHVHWQLDVLWDTPPMQRYDDFNSWLKRYNAGIRKLVNYWVDTMEREKKILGIVPFLGIMYSLLTGKPSELRCGAGINAFAISTSGKILACPIAPEWDWNILGDIWTSEPKDLPYKVTIDEPCKSCDLYKICGGRCLFANKTMLWGINGFRKVCGTVRFLVNELMRVKPKIERMIDEGLFDLEDFHYPKYNNTTEIIP